jgi:hypothetical protein
MGLQNLSVLDTDYEQRISHYKKNYPSVYELEFLQQNMYVIPVLFAKHHKEMLVLSVLSVLAPNDVVVIAYETQ